MRNKKLIVLFSVLLSITLLVVFNSVLFSVQHVNAYCANMEKSEYEESVLAAHRIKKGSSIFFVDKKKATERIEDNVSNVRVLNIEKKFPNRIYINFVEIREYIKLYYNAGEGGKTYFCSNDLRVMDVTDGSDNIREAINLKVKGEVKNLEVGDTLSFATSSVSAIVTELFAALERLGYYDTVIDLFTEIDLTGNFIELTTSTDMKWQILSADDLAEKMRFALSVYFSDKLTDLQKRTGTLIVTGAKSASYKGPGGGVVPV